MKGRPGVHDHQGCRDRGRHVRRGARGFAHLFKEGDGILAFTGAEANPSGWEMWVRRGKLSLNRTAVSIPGALMIGGEGASAIVESSSGNIADAVSVAIAEQGFLSLDNATETIRDLLLTNGGELAIGRFAPAHLTVDKLAIYGSRIDVYRDSTLTLKGDLSGSSTATASAAIAGEGVVKSSGDRIVAIGDGLRDVDLLVDARIDGSTVLRLPGEGTVAFRGNNTHASTIVEAGTLIVQGEQPQTSTLVRGGMLRGDGRVEDVLVVSGTLAPGIGHFETAGLQIDVHATFKLELAAFDPTEDVIGGDDTRHAQASSPFIIRDRLAVKGVVRLHGPTLLLTLGSIGPLTSFPIIDNDDTDPVEGTFAELPEGSTTPSS